MLPDRMDARLLSYASQTAPRYTSYPPSPHFSEAVTGTTVQDWLAELDPAAPISLYLHIPYCRDLCHYCACHTFGLVRDEPLADYVEHLVREIDLVAALSSAQNVNEIHWGGGTPNLLSPARFERIVSRIDAGFNRSVMREHAVEVDPRCLTAEHAEAFARAGVTRVSLGVQDLNDHVQAAIGRIQPFEQVAAAVAVLRAAGVAHINFDLMYGLPGQSLEDLRRSIARALSLAPDRLAIFGYAHVPWFKTRQKLIDEAMLPGAALRFEQVETVRADMAAAGYEAIGFDHFAKPDDPLAKAARAGRLHRNFQGYVDDECDVLLGVGASSISTFPQGYSQNITEVGAWSRALDEGRLPIARGRAVTDDDRLRRSMIERLLCDFELDLSAFGGAARYGAEIDALRPLAADGLVRLEGDRIAIPHETRQLVRLVAKAFDAYDGAGRARHSASV